MKDDGHVFFHSMYTILTDHLNTGNASFIVPKGEGQGYVKWKEKPFMKHFNLSLKTFDSVTIQMKALQQIIPSCSAVCLAYVSNQKLGLLRSFNLFMYMYT